MEEDSTVYVGFDVSKAKHAVAIAESGRTGEVRYFGEIEATPAAVDRFVHKLEKSKHPATAALRQPSALVGWCASATAAVRRAETAACQRCERARTSASQACGSISFSLV